ncbi:hypothetical protein PF010_g26312 [Phytophthora fragariae]|uniref:Uncharacterized protein n=1 Tax=Phytophthora fragariae TaxID=53985 RepID=A0A6G0JXP9_9STRA|nr:hypothetical protein PF010_g26312 [Phytophthora fragariae]
MDAFSSLLGACLAMADSSCPEEWERIIRQRSTLPAETLSQFDTTLAAIALPNRLVDEKHKTQPKRSGVQGWGLVSGKLPLGHCQWQVATGLIRSLLGCQKRADDGSTPITRSRFTCQARENGQQPVKSHHGAAVTAV